MYPMQGVDRAEALLVGGVQRDQGQGQGERRAMGERESVSVPMRCCRRMRTPMLEDESGDKEHHVTGSNWLMLQRKSCN